MAKDILMYGIIDSWSVGQFINDIDEVLEENESAPITVRVNSPGGDPDYGFGAVAKFAEIKNEKIVRVDGKAYSTALYYCCYTDNVVALDVSEFLLHRAAYDEWVESNPAYFTDARKAGLENANKKLRAAFEAKVNVPLFEQLCKCTLDEVFSMEGRKDVSFNAKIAKRIGLIKEIIQITPTKKAEIETLMLNVSALHNGFKIAAKAETEDKPKTMTKAELQLNHAAVYAEIFEAGKTAGITEMKQIAEVWAHYAPIDAKACQDGIKSGVMPSPVQVIELGEKKFSKKSLKEIEHGNAPDTPTQEDKNLSAKEKELQDFVLGVTKNSTFLSEAAKKQPVK
jgi:ATP-dependent protease ClpP protease subunit